MDLKQVETFLAVVETGSYSAAGMKLGMPESEVIEIIKYLEKYTGFHLLVTGKSGVMLTREGESLLPTINRLADEYKILDEVIDNEKEKI